MEELHMVTPLRFKCDCGDDLTVYQGPVTPYGTDVRVDHKGDTLLTFQVAGGNRPPDECADVIMEFIGMKIHDRREILVEPGWEDCKWQRPRGS